MTLYKCDHELLPCPNHQQDFDCNSFCSICEGEQEYCPVGCEPIACNTCCAYDYEPVVLTKIEDDFYQCQDCIMSDPNDKV